MISSSFAFSREGPSISETLWACEGPHAGPGTKLVKQITNSLGIAETTLQSEPYRQVFSAENAGVIEEYMYEAVRSGTAKRAAIEGLTICGKTGSAETSNDKNVATNAWYTGYIADERYPYAISVVIEKGGAGGQMATELAAKALKKAVTTIR